MRTVCKINQCTGCNACVNICHKDAIRIKDELEHYNAVIDESSCINCGMCEKICPVNNPVQKSKPIKICQGWSSDEDVRARASSGGVATAIALSFVRDGGVVCSCVFKDGKFVFDIAHNTDEVRGFTGSKYIKSNTEDIFKSLKKLLREGKRVLFIGLPCQVAGALSYTGNHENLYTVDLICHGSPSPKILKKFLDEKGIDINKAENIGFRKKGYFALFNGERSVEPNTVKDRYTYAFLGGICYTENCYSCTYASIERVGDITLGDSWGSELPEQEQKRGISLILCQSEKGERLMEMSGLSLFEVDAQKAIAHNGQLKAPSERSREHDIFFKLLKEKGSVSKAVKKCYPKACRRQDLKAFLIKTHILRR